MMMTAFAQATIDAIHADRAREIAAGKAEFGEGFVGTIYHSGTGYCCDVTRSRRGETLTEFARRLAGGPGVLRKTSTIVGWSDPNCEWYIRPEPKRGRDAARVVAWAVIAATDKDN